MGRRVTAFAAPALLTDRHDLTDFSCGVPSLDEWLKRRALPNQASGASRTYVTCVGIKTIGYYALAAGSVAVQQAPGKFRRNMPDPIPVALLGRLAIDKAFHGRNLGRALVKDAALRILNAAGIIGIRGILVHAISADAKAFYLAAGFDTSPIEPMILMATLSEVAALAEH